MILYTIYYPSQWFSHSIMNRAGISNYTISEAISNNSNNDYINPEMVRIEILLETENQAMIEKLGCELNKEIPETEMDYKNKNRGIIVKSNVSVTKIKNYSENQ